MITRDNYEEFFLLYMDNELSMADRRIVEQWVDDNPDLREEWEALLLCRWTTDDHAVFPAKERLLRQESAESPQPAVPFSGTVPAVIATVNESNYEEYFLSLVDRELNNQDKAAVELFIKRHPVRLPELDLLWQTVSQPETTVLFPDKASLYRTEKDRRPVWVPWLRITAAAVVLGAITLFVLPARHRDKTGSADNSISSHPATVTPATDSPATGLAVTDPVAAGVVPAGSYPVNKKDSAAVTTSSTTALHLTEDGTATQTATGKKTREHKDTRLLTASAGTTDKPASQLPGREQGSGGTEQQTPVLTSRPTALPGDLAVTPPAGTVPVKETALTPPAAARQVTIPREQSSFATQALLKEEADNNGQGLLVSAEPASTGKNRFRGIFRRVTRAFGKTADRDNEGQREVLIGAFQVGIK